MVPELTQTPGSTTGRQATAVGGLRELVVPSLAQAGVDVPGDDALDVLRATVAAAGGVFAVALAVARSDGGSWPRLR